jgi:hypothetical protein
MRRAFFYIHIEKLSIRCRTSVAASLSKFNDDSALAPLEGAMDSPNEGSCAVNIPKLRGMNQEKKRGGLKSKHFNFL